MMDKKDILKKIGVNPQSGKKSSLGMRPEHEQKLQSILDDIKRAGIKYWINLENLLGSF